MASLWSVTVDIYEPQGAGREYPVVRHTFFGKTKTEATHYLESHLKTDVFLRECLSKGGYRGIECEAFVKTERLR